MMLINTTTKTNFYTKTTLCSLVFTARHWSHLVSNELQLQPDAPSFQDVYVLGWVTEMKRNGFQFVVRDNALRRVK